MLKIIRNQGKVAAMGQQSVSICKITNVWLFNDKKTVSNRNIKSKGPNIEPLGIPRMILAQSRYAEPIFVLCLR